MQKEEVKVWFAHLSNGGISYYRMIQFAEEMTDIDGVFPIMQKFKPDEHDQFRRNYEINPDKEAEYINQIAEMCDMMVVQQVTSSKLLCYFKAYKEVLHKTLICELDDNPFEAQSFNPHYGQIGPGTDYENNAYDQIKMSDAVICSTDYLKETLMNYNKRCYTIPNAIDFDVWEPLEVHTKPDMVRIGWSGGAGHYNDLKPIKHALKQLLNEHDNLEFCIIHGEPGFIDHPRFVYRCEDWVPITEYPKEYCNAGFDIVIAPLRDTEFNRCKSNVRYLEASAKKIPVVASDVEPYRKTIEHGKDGFLYREPKEFLDILRKLVKDSKLRAQIGQEAYKKIKRDFDSKIVAKKYAELLKTIYQDMGSGRLSHHSG